jgi:hypothetical protein
VRDGGRITVQVSQNLPGLGYAFDLPGNTTEQTELKGNPKMP